MIDPLKMDVPEIGKKVDSIPVDRVMAAMESLEEELKLYYAAQALELEDAIARVRELHKPYQWDMLLPNSLLCFECSKIDERGTNMFSIPYPCLTIEALDGEQ